MAGYEMDRTKAARITIITAEDTTEKSYKEAYSAWSMCVDKGLVSLTIYHVPVFKAVLYHPDFFDRRSVEQELSDILPGGTLRPGAECAFCSEPAVDIVGCAGGGGCDIGPQPVCEACGKERAF